MYDSDASRHAPSDSRARIRTLFARLLDGPGPDAAPAPDPFDDPFGDELFSERAFEGDGASRSAPILGDGFDGLGAWEPSGGDGYGGSHGDGLSDDEMPELGDGLSDPFAWDEPEGAAENAEGGLDDSIFADPGHMESLLGEAAAAEARGGASAQDETVEEDRVESPSALPARRLASGFAATLDALPDRPPSGAHRVAVVALANLDQLNEQLDIGWRVIQMLPGAVPAEFVVALRYAGYAA